TLFFLSGVVSGVLNQVNLDAYLGKFQDLTKMMFTDRPGKWKLSKVAFYLQSLLFSLTATSITAATMGSSGLVAWITTGVMFGAGLTLNKIVSKKYAKTKEMFDAKENGASCV